MSALEGAAAGARVADATAELQAALDALRGRTGAGRPSLAVVWTERAACAGPVHDLARMAARALGVDGHDRVGECYDGPGCDACSLLAECGALGDAARHGDRALVDEALARLQAAGMGSHVRWGDPAPVA